MRTCQNCGCYIPDKWTTCPACWRRVEPVLKEKKTEWNSWRDGTRYTEEKPYKGSYSKCYCVKIYYKDDTTVDTIFTTLENALNYAQKKIDKFWYYVQFIEVWDCQTQARIGLFYPNS